MQVGMRHAYFIQYFTYVVYKRKQDLHNNKKAYLLLFNKKTHIFTF